MRIKLTILLIMTLLFVTGCSQTNVQTTEQEQLTTSSDSKEDLLSELEAMTAKASQEYSVTYSEEVEGQGVMDVALYVKGEKMLMESSGEEGKVSLYFLETEAYMCSYQEKWSCLKLSGEEDEKQEAPTETIEYEWDDYENSTEFNIVRDGTITVAGTKANCYKSEYEGTSQRFCLSKDGVPLYNNVVENGKIVSEFEAKSYSNKVDDSKFKIPQGAEIVDMSSFYTG